jgi:para-nitrobenzyl esterase
MKHHMTGAVCALALGVSVIAGTGAIFAQAAPNSAAPVKVKIDAGVLVGETKDGVNVFRGVPFAKAPVGELRWKPPVKPAAWSYDRQAVQYGSPCPQVTNPDGVTANGGGVAHTPNEDCLYLNVVAPANATKAPVLVWLYGGASRLGAGSLGSYDGTSNAKEGVITVTPNYRLGALGGFSHPALTKDAKAGEGLGSYALMDAVAALEWVKANAESFGGDPNNVTLAGQSAGGFMVTHLLSVPSAKGLYHKAIIQSGAGLVPALSLKDAEKRGADAMKAFGLGETATAAQLRAIDASSIANTKETLNLLGTPVDGRFMTTVTADALKAGTEIDVPVMVGSNSGEGGFNRAKEVAAGAGDTGAGAWLYHFSYVPEWRTEWKKGAIHSAEIMYAFNSIDTSSWAKGPNGKAGEKERAVAKRVNACWVAFFKMDPKAKSLTCADGFSWPAYTAANDAVAEFKETPVVAKASAIPDGPPAG